jgi:dTDP-4-dehydrorhamnose reductase
VRVLILGGTGLLGRALLAEADEIGLETVSLARADADIVLDIRDETVLQAALAKIQPDLVINAAALVDLAVCEADEDLAFAINAAPLHVLANWSVQSAKPMVQISTDHLFDGDGNMAHDEQAKVTLCNAYARSKYAGEQIALAAPDCLVVRTSLAGFHPDGRGFAAWAMTALSQRQDLVLFDDYYGSTLDIRSLSRAIFELVSLGANGVLNVASSEVFSKKTFLHALADAAGIELDWARTGSVAGLKPRRGRSLGLHVRKAEILLGRSLPDLSILAQNLVEEWRALP